MMGQVNSYDEQNRIDNQHLIDIEQELFENETPQLDPTVLPDTAFDIIARCNGFKHLYGRVYTAPNNRRYIRTKFGFHTETSFNNGVMLRKANIEITELEQRLIKRNEQLQEAILESSGARAQLRGIQKLQTQTEHTQETLNRKMELLRKFKSLLKKNFVLKRIDGLISVVEESDIPDNKKLELLSSYLREFKNEMQVVDQFDLSKE